MRPEGEKICDVIYTKISDNGQIRAESAAIVFWNQGNTEAVIDSNFRLAAAKLNPVTNLLEGGEAYRFEDPTGRMIIHTFDAVFTPGSNPAATTAFNNLTVQMIVYLTPTAGT